MTSTGFERLQASMAKLSRTIEAQAEIKGDHLAGKVADFVDGLSAMFAPEPKPEEPKKEEEKK